MSAVPQKLDATCEHCVFGVDLECCPQGAVTCKADAKSMAMPPDAKQEVKPVKACSKQAKMLFFWLARSTTTAEGVAMFSARCRSPSPELTASTAAALRWFSP